MILGHIVIRFSDLDLLGQIWPKKAQLFNQKKISTFWSKISWPRYVYHIICVLQELIVMNTVADPILDNISKQEMPVQRFLFIFVHPIR